jgi:hypothetical protein
MRLLLLAILISATFSCVRTIDLSPPPPDASSIPDAAPFPDSAVAIPDASLAVPDADLTPDAS